MKNQIKDLLMDLNPEVDYDSCTTLIDDRHINSLTMVSLVADLEDGFDIEIPAVDIVPENFNSLDAIACLVKRLQDEED